MITLTKQRIRKRKSRNLFGRRLRFKAHNCFVVDTRHALGADGKLVRGGVKQTTITLRFTGRLAGRRLFVASGFMSRPAFPIARSVAR